MRGKDKSEGENEGKRKVRERMRGKEKSEGEKSCEKLLKKGMEKNFK